MKGENLEVSGLVKRLGGRVVVSGVSLSVPEGAIVGLLGPNGAGKTTAFRMILGLLPQDAGCVRFGRVLDGLPLFRRARLGLGYLPQGPSIFRGLSVRNNLIAVLEANGHPDRNTRADALLERFGLTAFAGHKASSLSGGERRKLEFARALCAEPRVLLLDEPFAGVDPLAAERIAAAVRELADEGIGILLTDHNVQDALHVCDTVHILAEGSIVESGSARDIVESETARRIYLGKRFLALPSDAEDASIKE